MSLKLKLTSAVALFVLILGVLIMSVFATTQTINIKGNLVFNAPDRSLYVKDISIQTEPTGTSETIDNFIPGYLNKNFNLELGTVQTESGIIELHFDIINTTENYWNIASVELPEALTSQGIIASYSGIIEVNSLTDADGDGYKEITDVATAPYGTLVLTITAPTPTSLISLDLSGIAVTIDSIVEDNIIYSFSFLEGNNAEIVSYSGSGGDVVIPRSFSITTEETNTPGYSKIFITLEDFNAYTGNMLNQQILSFGFFNIITNSKESISVKNFNTDMPTLTEEQFPITIETTNFSISYDDYSTNNTIFNKPLSDVIYGKVSNATITLNDGQIFEINSSNAEEKQTEIEAYSFTEGSFPAEVSYPSERIIYTEGEDYIVTSIGYYAFSGFSNITSITVPSSVESIGWGAFSLCPNLKNVYFEENSQIMGINPGTFYNCSSLTSITIPSSVREISNSAFEGCGGLTSIVIPESVISIGLNAFAGCDNLATVTINEYIYTSASSSSSCEYILENAQTVYVPEELVNNSTLTMGSYLQNKFTQGELVNGLYTYTRNP